jgi:hypothetical protein
VTGGERPRPPAVDGLELAQRYPLARLVAVLVVVLFDLVLEGGRGLGTERDLALATAGGALRLVPGSDIVAVLLVHSWPVCWVVVGQRIGSV